MSNEYVKPQQEYRNVDFEFNRVNLLWNCCAIVKKLLTLQVEVDELEHKVNNIPDDIDATFAEQAAQLQSLNSAVTTLREQMDDVLDSLDSDEAALETISATVTNLDHDVTTLQGLVSTLNSSVSQLTSRVSTNETNITNLTSAVSNQGTRLTTAEGKVTQLETKSTTLTNSLNTLTELLTDNDYYTNSDLTSEVTATNAAFTISERELWKTPYGGWLKLKVAVSAGNVSTGTQLAYVTGNAATILRGTYNQNLALYGQLGGFPYDGQNQGSRCLVVAVWDETNNRFNIVLRGDPMGTNTQNPSASFYIPFFDALRV